MVIGGDKHRQPLGQGGKLVEDPLAARPQLLQVQHATVDLHRQRARGANAERGDTIGSGAAAIGVPPDQQRGQLAAGGQRIGGGDQHRVEQPVVDVGVGGDAGEAPIQPGVSDDKLRDAAAPAVPVQLRHDPDGAQRGQRLHHGEANRGRPIRRLSGLETRPITAPSTPRPAISRK